jgi:hypothetical protein
MAALEQMSYHMASSKKQETINELNHAVAREYDGSQSNVLSETCALRKKK